MAKWTEEKEEQLIALVEERPPLYNITLQGYSNRNRKEQLWREIVSELHLSGNMYPTFAQLANNVCAQQRMKNQT